MSKTGRKSKKHFPELDGMRGIAVGGVMLFHFLQLLAPGPSLAGRLVAASRLGQTGVDLFFVLSGFLITGILLDSRADPHYFRNFYARRVLRIFPLHYLGLALFFFVFMPMAGQGIARFRDQLWGWGFLINIPATFRMPADHSLPVHFWSLAVEEHFYFVWPLLVWLAPRRWLAVICLSLIPIALLSRWLLYRHGFAEFYFTLCRTDSLAMGGLVAIIYRWRPPTFRTMLITAVLAGAICIPLWFVVGGKGIPIITLTHSTIIAIAYAMFLATAVFSPAGFFLKRILSLSVLRFFGKYSYALYVFHAMIPFPWKFEAYHALVPNNLLAMLLMCAVNGAISVVAALLSWNLLEKHCLQLKTFFEYHAGEAHLAPAMQEPPESQETKDASTVPAP